MEPCVSMEVDGALGFPVRKCDVDSSEKGTEYNPRVGGWGDYTKETI